MRRLLIILLSITLLPALLLASITINQALQDTLTTHALTNIEPLPDDLADVYKSYLNEYPDGVMAYLIMAERSATLWNADPVDLFANYLRIQQLLELEDFDCSAEFFLSYIAKITIGNEKLTPYRDRFSELGLLKLREQHPDLLERIRAVNLWCRENMTFVSTSGRTQDPLSIVDKSHIGRCGEMQVFFISACRTVGIPARPAWTPWWPHTDNNHAWTEVFVDGHWHYVENAQPDYHLNSTWFSGSVNKALLVLARSSFPDSLDEVVSETGSTSYVNSTRYYQQTRNIAFSVIDADNSPVPEAAVNIMAFNFSLLRPLLEIKTDSCGRAKLDISTGGFLAVAFKDSLFDYVLVPYDSSGAPASYTLRIKERSWEHEELLLEYPPGKGQRQDDPEFFAARKRLAAKRYNALIDSIQSQEVPTGAPAADSNFVELFNQSRNNKLPLLKLVEAHPDIPADFWVKALMIDAKFYWQANLLQWEQLYATYLDLATRQLTEDSWSSLLAPSIYYEQLPLVSVPAEYIVNHNLSTGERIPAVLDVIHSRHTIDEEEAPGGLLSLGNMLAAPFLQDYQFKMLSCYVLKANQIPAQYTRIPSTIALLSDSVWSNYDVKENRFTTQAPDIDSGTGTLVDVAFKLQDEAGLPVTLNPDNIATTLFQEGRFYYNDRQLDYDRENSRLAGQLEPGDFQLQICIRESGEVTRVKLVSLQLEAGKTIDDTLTFQEFQRRWEFAAAVYHEFLNGFMTTESGDLVVLLGDYDNEPVQRLATRVRSRLTGQRFVWVGGNPPSVEVADYSVDASYPRFLEEHPELKHRLITFYYDRENDKWSMFEGIWDILYK